MPGDIEPSDLARLVDLAERPRVDDWSLRSATVRYAQPEPERASRLLECVRRLDGALHGHARLLREDGPVIWDEFTAPGRGADGAHRDVVQLLEVASELDRLGDLLASWAAAWPAERPIDEIDQIVADAAARLDALDVPREEPPSARGFDRPGRR